MWSFTSEVSSLTPEERAQAYLEGEIKYAKEKCLRYHADINVSAGTNAKSPLRLDGSREEISPKICYGHYSVNIRGIVKLGWKSPISITLVNGMEHRRANYKHAKVASVLWFEDKSDSFQAPIYVQLNDTVRKIMNRNVTGFYKPTRRFHKNNPHIDLIYASVSPAIHFPTQDD